MLTKIRWQNTDIATQALVNPMLDDIDINDKRVREAARKYALHCIEEWQGQLNMGNWQCSVGLFVLGYEQALTDLFDE